MGAGQASQPPRHAAASQHRLIQQGAVMGCQGWSASALLASVSGIALSVAIAVPGVRAQAVVDLDPVTVISAKPARAPARQVAPARSEPQAPPSPAAPAAETPPPPAAVAQSTTPDVMPATETLGAVSTIRHIADPADHADAPVRSALQRARRHSARACRRSRHGGQHSRLAGLWTRQRR